MRELKYIRYVNTANACCAVQFDLISCLICRSQQTQFSVLMQNFEISFLFVASCNFIKQK